MVISTPLQAQMDPVGKWCVGLSAHGGFSNLVNQNNYGLPKMAYKPEVILLAGGRVARVLKPWARIQADVQWFEGRYTFSDRYASGSTIGRIDLRKELQLSLVQVGLTYRHYLIPSDWIRTSNPKTIDLGLRQRHSFFVFAGPRVSFIRDARVNFTMRSELSGQTWQAADLIDIKPAFDVYVPTDRLPDHLPEQGRDLFGAYILEAWGGAGWNMHLGPFLSLALEVALSASLNDFNSSARNTDGSYRWRHRVYSGTDPRSYFPSVLYTTTLGASLQYRF